jgi:hypothetical protein
MELASFWVAGLQEFLVQQEALPLLEEVVEEGVFLFVQAVEAVVAEVVVHLIQVHKTT